MSPLYDDIEITTRKSGTQESIPFGESSDMSYWYSESSEETFDSSDESGGSLGSSYLPESPDNSEDPDEDSASDVSEDS